MREELKAAFEEEQKTIKNTLKILSAEFPDLEITKKERTDNGFGHIVIKDPQSPFRAKINISPFEEKWHYSNQHGHFESCKAGSIKTLTKNIADRRESYIRRLKLKLERECLKVSRESKKTAICDRLGLNRDSPIGNLAQQYRITEDYHIIFKFFGDEIESIEIGTDRLNDAYEKNPEGLPDTLIDSIVNIVREIENEN